MDRTSKLVLVVVAAVVVVAAATATVLFWPREAPRPGPVTVTDALNRTVQLPSSIQRVVVLAPSITEAMVYLGVDNLIVGADSFSLESWFMNTSTRLRERNVTSVGGFWWTTIKVEEILKLKPDLVLADAGAHVKLLETFESYNLTAVFLHGGSAATIEDVEKDVELLGKIFGREEKARELVQKIREAIEEARAGLARKGLAGLRVLVVIDFYQGIWVAGRGTFVDNLLSKLGLVNAATVEGWAAASIEQIAEWKPSVVIVACSYATWETVNESGLPRLGVPIVLLSSRDVDAVSRPGPMLLYAPEVVRSAVEKALARASTQQVAAVLPRRHLSTPCF
ncbi:MAG: ABC transporter substrate-binding protein [Desulfurococcaceae archaeon]